MILFLVDKMTKWIIFPMVIVALLVLVGIIFTIIFWKKKKDGKMEEPNFQVFFILGICFLPMDIVFMIVISPVFIFYMALGLCYIAIGLANKNKWKKE